jgi:single-strand DNA-binding protein
MSGSFNKVSLLGRLGQDPEIRSLNSGDKVANINLATSESWKDKTSGEWKEKTEWHKVVVFNQNLVKTIEANLHKGDLVHVEGALQTREYDKDGGKRSVTEIVLSQFRGELNMIIWNKPKAEAGAEAEA